MEKLHPNNKDKLSILGVVSWLGLAGVFTDVTRQNIFNPFMKPSHQQQNQITVIAKPNNSKQPNQIQVTKPNQIIENNQIK